MAYLIGLSLSYCVSDILRGKVKYEEVIKIIVGIVARNAEEWEDVIRSNTNPDNGYTVWIENPEEAARILYQLIKDNKIDQPRLRGEEVPQQDGTHWRNQKGEKVFFDL